MASTQTSTAGPAKTAATSSEVEVPFAPPSIGPEEIAEVVGVLESGWLSTGPRVASFERAFAEYTGAPHAIAVNSCTAALHLSLLDRKSTRLNSSHSQISYAVFCLKNKLGVL